MGSCASVCTTTVVEIIPDRDTMIEVVDTIVKFEELLKRGQELTVTEKKEFKRIEKVAKEMKKVKQAVKSRSETIDLERD